MGQAYIIPLNSPRSMRSTLEKRQDEIEAGFLTDETETYQHDVLGHLY